jgi:hypothetical protein
MRTQLRFASTNISPIYWGMLALSIGIGLLPLWGPRLDIRIVGNPTPLYILGFVLTLFSLWLARSHRRTVVSVDAATRTIHVRTIRALSKACVREYTAGDVVSVIVECAEGEGMMHTAQVRMRDGEVYDLNKLAWKEGPAVKSANAFLAAIGQQDRKVDWVFNVSTESGEKFRDEYLRRQPSAE